MTQCVFRDILALGMLDEALALLSGCRADLVLFLVGKTAEWGAGQ